MEGEKKMIDLSAFDCFLIDDEVTQNTRKSYLTTMRLFFKRYTEFNKQNALGYKMYCIERFKPSTVNNKICGMERYSQFLGRPVKLKRVKQHKATSVENVISKEQYEKLVNGLKADKKTRFLIIVLLMARTGGRISEVLRFKKRDIIKGYVDMQTKGKIRRIFFPQKLKDEIKDYIEGISDDEYLCKNRLGKRITARGVSSNLIAAAHKFDIPKEVMHPHSFRHFFAIEFLKRNNNISLLADLLGHSGVNTTMIYLRMSQEEQKNAIDKAVDW